MRDYGKLKSIFVNRVAAGQIKPATAKKFGDGAGLYLKVAPEGTASWIFRYERDGKRTYMGLGSLRDVPLAEARRLAADARLTLAAYADPREQRVKERADARAAAASSITFKAATEAFLKSRTATSNAKHNAQWRSTLERYAYPKMGSLPVSSIDRSHVLAVLEPVWKDKPETARRVRGRIEAVLDAAAARGWRGEFNPASIRAVKPVLGTAKPKAIHHASLPYKALPAFMKLLRAQSGFGAMALQFLILTAARTSEVLGAQWPEVDEKLALWSIPPVRMKARKVHRVPLSPAALKVYKEAAKLRHSPFIFPGRKDKRPASNMTLAAVLRRMKMEEITVHGFRSTFRDWAAERTDHPREVIEAALAHVVGGVEGAYFRSDLFEKRRTLMNDWARFIDTGRA